MMSKLPLAAAVTLLGATAVYADSERYDFDGFNSVEVSSGVTVIIEEGENFHVEAEARRGNLRRLIIEQNGDTLSITRKQRRWFLGFWNNDRFIVHIDMPDLMEAQASSGSSIEIEASGNGDLSLMASSGSTIEFEDFEGGSLGLKSTSGSTIKGDDIAAGSVEVHATSGSSVKLSGDCEFIEATSQSGSTISAHDLECASGELEAGGGSTLRAHTDAAVKAKASGGASISIYGNPPSADTTSGGGASLNLR